MGLDLTFALIFTGLCLSIATFLPGALIEWRDNRDYYWAVTKGYGQRENAMKRRQPYGSSLTAMNLALVYDYNSCLPVDDTIARHLFEGDSPVYEIYEDMCDEMFNPEELLSPG